MSQHRKLRGLEERGDPVGPTFDQLEQQERIRLLREGKKNFDPKFGGSPVFRPLKHDKRVIWQRYPRAWIFGVAAVMTASVYAPIFYVWLSDSRKPLTEIEKKDAKIINQAIDDKFRDSWQRHWIFRAREK